VRLKPRNKKKSPYTERAETMSERMQSREPIKRTRFNIEKEKNRKKLPKAAPGERRFLKNVSAIDLKVTIILRTEIYPEDYPQFATKKSILKYIEQSSEWMNLLTDDSRDSYVEIIAEGESLD